MGQHIFDIGNAGFHFRLVAHGLVVFAVFGKVAEGLGLFDLFGNGITPGGAQFAELFFQLVYNFLREYVFVCHNCFPFV